MSIPKKFFIFFALIFSFFLVPKISYGIDIAPTSSLGILANQNGGLIQLKFKAEENILDKITLKIAKSSTILDEDLTISLYSDSSQNNLLTSTIIPKTSFQNDINENTGVDNMTEYTFFLNSYSTTIGTTYYLTFDCGVNAGAGYLYYLITTDKNFYIDGTAGKVGYNLNMGDLWFSTERYTRPTTYIDFITPTSTIDGFRRWGLDYYIDEDDYSSAYPIPQCNSFYSSCSPDEFGWFFIVAYEKDLGLTNYDITDYDYWDYSLPMTLVDLTNTEISINKSITMASNTSWIAKAYIVNFNPPDLKNETTGNIWVVAESDEWNFTISDNNEISEFSAWSLNNSPTSTASAGWEFTCDPESGLFQYSMCNMFATLFYVNPETAFQKFYNLKDEIKYKPPFAYFTVYQNAFKENLSTSTTSTVSGLVTEDYNVIADKIMTISIFENIYTIIEWCLWLLFVIWVINRFRFFYL